MKYSLTPFNIAAGLLSILAAYSYLTSPEGGDGLQNFWVIPMITTACSLLIINYILQRSISSYKFLLGLEGTLLILMFLSYKAVLKNENNPIFNVPNDFSNGYISVIYDVPQAKDLFSRSKPIPVPQSGILLTKAPLKDIRSVVSFQSSKPNGNENNNYASFFGKISCEQKDYDYQVWYQANGTRIPPNLEALKNQVSRDMIGLCHALSN